MVGPISCPYVSEYQFHCCRKSEGPILESQSSEMRVCSPRNKGYSPLIDMSMTMSTMKPVNSHPQTAKNQVIAHPKRQIVCDSDLTK